MKHEEAIEKADEWMEDWPSTVRVLQAYLEARAVADHSPGVTAFLDAEAARRLLANFGDTR